MFGMKLFENNWNKLKEIIKKFFYIDTLVF